MTELFQLHEIDGHDYNEWHRALPSNVEAIFKGKRIGVAEVRECICGSRQIMVMN